MIILPDNDSAGRHYGDAVCQLLAALVPQPTIRIVQLPNLPEGGDVVDWIDAHGDAAEPDELRQQIEVLAEAAEPEPIQPGPHKTKAETRPPFPTDAFPNIVRDYVIEASAAIGCDPSFIAIPVMGCMARAIGNKRTIELKRTWHEPAVIWGAIVAKSGQHKTPAIELAIAPLKRTQAASLRAHSEALAHHELDQAIYERDVAAWKRGKVSGPPPSAPQEPTCDRYIVSDITIEALADRLANQFDGVLLVRDELAGWVNGIAEYKGGKGSDLGHWLACWSAASWTNDRKGSVNGRKIISLPRAAVSIVGGIQPEVLRSASLGNTWPMDFVLACC